MRRLYLALCVLIVAALLVGCGHTSKSTPVPLKPLAPKPGAVAPPAGEAPSCGPKVRAGIEAGHGELGACAPNAVVEAPTAQFAALVTQSAVSHATGPDVSNNNPFYGWAPVKRAGHPFAYLKTIQGTAYVDSTASAMAKAARAAGVIPGGYDFLEVCKASSAGEARLFAARLKAIGLVGHAFLPVGDAEWPLHPDCTTKGARAWITSWIDTVHSLTGRWPAIYTGAWWSNPVLGCWRPPHAKRWVSGYGPRSRLSIPCGWGGVDLWQYTDAGFNGVSTTDMSRLEVPASAFTGSTAPTRAQTVARWHRELNTHYTLRAELHSDIDRHHCRLTPPTLGHAKPPKYHTLCGRWLQHGHEEARTISAFHAKNIY
jgi:GH25 family lysozyme M1 (1,4-beta-N-acetylmuramidase)